MDKKYFYASDLIDSVIDFVRINPQKSYWTKSKLSDNEPRLFRFLQCCSLLRAFVIKPTISDFIDGIFIDKITKDRLLKIQHKLFNLSDCTFIDLKIKRMNLHDLIYIFTRAYKFKYLSSDLSYFWSNRYEIPRIGGALLYHETNKCISDVKNSIKRIDDILCTIISPENNRISKSDLIADFDYPDVDLLEIDTENF